MKFSLIDFFLEFHSPFTIAHGTRTGTAVVLLKIEMNGIEAWGEASLPPYLHETQESVRDFVTSFLTSLQTVPDLNSILEQLHNYKEHNYAAKACVDIAMHNLFAAMQRIPVHRLLDISLKDLPFCTFTIGIDNEEVLLQKLQDASLFRVLKLKLGGDDDKTFVEFILNHTDKKICVDVNQGWHTKEEALEMIVWLNEKNILFVEQPLPKIKTEDQLWLFEKSPLPLYADESVQTSADIAKIKDCFHGINIKLMKCGGISQALKMVKLAREFNLKVMIGSMSETGCAIQAAAQISPLADWADLDGPLLTKNNPFKNITYENGKLVPL